jgi:predicted DNA-binding protein YlxM (UPF0122 family)
METSDLKLPEIQVTDIEEIDDSPIALLNPRQQRFTHLYLSGQYTLDQIAQLLNVSKSTVRVWLRSPKVKGAIETFQMDEDEIVKQGLKALRLKAMYAMNELMDSKVDGIKWQAAKDILDRTGHKAPTKQEVTVEVKTFEQQLSELMVEKNIEDDFIEGYAEVIDDGKETN